jgi:tetratricopeptide (TPR) repeat protein
MRKLLRETHRRAVWQVFAVYVGVSWAVLQVVDVVTQNMGLPPWVFPFALVLLLLGLPVMLATAIIQGRMTGAESASESDWESVPTSTVPAPSARQPDTRLHKRGLFTWKNAIMGGAAAASLFAVVLGGYAFARRAGLGSAGTLVAKGLIEDGERLILAEFAGDPDMAEAATMALRVDLSQSPTVTLADPTFIAAVLARMERPPETPLEEDVAVEAAVREGIKAVVAGEVARVGGGYVFTARLVAAETGQDLLNLRESASDSSQVLETIDRLSRRMRERMGESLGSIRASAPLDRATTTSLEALRKYSQALAAEDGGDRDLARALLHEAIGIDSTFAMAWRKLAVVDVLTDVSAAREAATRAYELRDLLTDRERYITIGTYHSTVTGDVEAGITAYRALLDQYPNDAWALNNLANLYGRQGNPAAGTELLTRAIALDPYSPNAYVNLSGVLHYLGERDSAWVVASELEEAATGHPWVQYLRSRMAAAEWEFEIAQENVDILLRSGRSAARRQGLEVQAFIDVARGQLRDSDRHFEDAQRRDDAVARADWHAWNELSVRQQRASAVRILEEALAAAGDLDTVDGGTGRAFFFALAGRPEEARRWLEADRRADEAYASQPAPVRAATDAWFEAFLAYGEGRFTDAVASLKEAEREFDSFYSGLGQRSVSWDLARAYDQAGMADSAIARYELSLDYGSAFGLEAETRRIPITLRRLGQLYDGQGDLERAAGYYGRFVELWADADPDLQPRVEEARSRLEEIVRKRG